MRFRYYAEKINFEFSVKLVSGHPYQHVLEEYKAYYSTESEKWVYKVRILKNILLRKSSDICLGFQVVRCELVMISEPPALIISSPSAVTDMSELPSNSQLSQPFWNLECHRKHVDFFMETLPYTFFNSRYDSGGFLFGLRRNFRAFSCSHISNTLIFGGEVHHWPLLSYVAYKPLNYSAQNLNCR